MGIKREKIYIDGVLHLKCPKCGQILPAKENFYVKKTGHYDTGCKKCRHPKRGSAQSTQNKANICIDCQNACGGCSWTAVDLSKKGHPIKFEPVPGWDAVPISRYADGRIIKTYSIRSCPQFVPDERRKTDE